MSEQRNSLIDPKAGDVVKHPRVDGVLTVWHVNNRVEYYKGTGDPMHAHMFELSLDSWREWIRCGSVVKRAEDS